MLSAAVSQLEQELEVAFSNTETTAETCAQKISSAINTFLIQGSILHVGTYPVIVWQQLTGIDAMSAGVGLDTGKPVFIANVLASLSNTGNTVQQAAQILSQEILALYLKAIVNLTATTSPFPPTPLGLPTSGVITGGIEKPFGSGLLVPILKQDLQTNFENISQTCDSSVEKIAIAVVNFAKTARIAGTCSGLSAGGTAWTGQLQGVIS